MGLKQIAKEAARKALKSKVAGVLVNITYLMSAVANPKYKLASPLCYHSRIQNTAYRI